MSANEEVKRIVLIHLLTTYPQLNTFNDLQWDIAYKVVRANAVCETLKWKIANLDGGQEARI